MYGASVKIQTLRGTPFSEGHKKIKADQRNSEYIQTTKGLVVKRCTTPSAESAFISLCHAFSPPLLGYAQFLPIAQFMLIMLIIFSHIHLACYHILQVARGRH